MVSTDTRIPPPKPRSPREVVQLEKDPEPAPKVPGVDTYFTDEMGEWLRDRLNTWLQNYAKWQIYYVAEQVRQQSEPEGGPERAYFLTDVGASDISDFNSHAFKLNLLRSNPRYPMILAQLKLTGKRFSR